MGIEERWVYDSDKILVHPFASSRVHEFEKVVH